MKKIIFGNSKFRLVLAIFAISLMMIGCGNSTEPTDDKPIVPDEFTLTTVPATLPVEDVWVIANNGSPTKEDFDALEKLLNSDAAKDRKITLNFPNIEAIPAYAFFYYDTDTDTDTGVETIVAVSAPKATSIGYAAFNYCAALTTANFPMATTIGEWAFFECTALTTASFPVATTIGENAFSLNTALTTVSFPVATSIGDGAFGDCDALTTANFPVATSIGYAAFDGCDALTTVSFPKATTIGDFAFNNCPALTTMEIATGSTLGTIPSTAFDGTTDTANITVTTSAANKSKFEANGWQFKFL